MKTPPVLSIPKSQVKAAITPEMIQAGQAYIMAKAALDVIEPIVKKYQREILEKYQFTNKGQIDRRATTRGRGETEVYVISDPKDSYNLSDEDFLVYHNECNAKRVEAGLHVDNSEQCPLLIAESLVRNAETSLLDIMEPLLGFNSSASGLWKEDFRKKAVDLSIALLVMLDLLKNPLQSGGTKTI